MNRRFVTLVTFLLLAVVVAVPSWAHTEPGHQHQWSTHGVVADGLLVGHNSVIVCVDGNLNFDTKYERHLHYEKKNSTDVWRQSTHYVDALRYGPAWNVCG